MRSFTKPAGTVRGASKLYSRAITVTSAGFAKERSGAGSSWTRVKAAPARIRAAAEVAIRARFIGRETPLAEGMPNDWARENTNPEPVAGGGVTATQDCGPLRTQDQQPPRIGD